MLFRILTRMVTPSLTSALPREIIMLISESIRNQTDLLNFLSTCRQLYVLLLPQLYRNPIQVGRLGVIRRAVSFVQTILRRPDLARSVCDLSLECVEATLCWYEVHGPDPDLEYDSALIMEAVQMAAHSAEEREGWELEIVAGNCDAWLALLLPALSRLKAFHFTFSNQATFVARMLQRAVNRERPFTTNDPLRSVEVLTASWSMYFDADIDTDASDMTLDLTLFAKLPALRSLSGHQITTRGRGPDQLSIQPLSSRITMLDFCSSVSPDGMIGLIQCCEAVRFLKFTQIYDEAGFRPTAFRRSLSLTKMTLEELWIDYSDYGYPEDDRENEWIGSFRDFSRLRKLHIRLPNLFTWQPSATHSHGTPVQRLTGILPSSIETLCITGCLGEQGHALVSQLEHLIKNKKIHTPRLRQVEIYIDFLIEEEACTALQSLCEKEKVDLAIRRWWDVTDLRYPNREDGYRLQDTFWLW